MEVQVAVVESMDPREFEAKVKEKLEDGWGVKMGSYQVATQVVPSGPPLNPKVPPTLSLMVLRSILMVKGMPDEAR